MTNRIFTPSKLTEQIAMYIVNPPICFNINCKFIGFKEDKAVINICEL